MVFWFPAYRLIMVWSVVTSLIGSIGLPHLIVTVLKYLTSMNHLQDIVNRLQESQHPEIQKAMDEFNGR